MGLGLRWNLPLRWLALRPADAVAVGVGPWPCLDPLGLDLRPDAVAVGVGPWLRLEALGLDLRPADSVGLGFRV